MALTSVSQISFVPPSNRVVVAIEQPAKLLAKGLVIQKKRTQYERLEKPGYAPNATSSDWLPSRIAPSDPKARKCPSE